MVRWSVVSGLAGHMPSHLTPLPSPPPPVLSALPVSAGSCLLPRRLDSPSGRGSCRLGLGVGGPASEQPVAVATLASLWELWGEVPPGKATDGGRRGRVIPSGAVVHEAWHLSAWLGGEAEMPPCPALSHGHPPGSPPELSWPCLLPASL